MLVASTSIRSQKTSNASSEAHRDGRATRPHAHDPRAGNRACARPCTGTDRRRVLALHPAGESEAAVAGRVRGVQGADASSGAPHHDPAREGRARAGSWVAAMTSPIEKLFANANMRCTICRKPADDPACKCWTRCFCGWSHVTGGQCPRADEHPAIRLLSTVRSTGRCLCRSRYARAKVCAVERAWPLKSPCRCACHRKDVRAVVAAEEAADQRPRCEAEHPESEEQCVGEPNHEREHTSSTGRRWRR